MLDKVMYWVGSHPEWSFLFLFSLLIVPTWFIFRHAPRNTRHTVPQGFFIQVFLSIQFYMWLFVCSAVLRLCGLGLDLVMTISFVVGLPLLGYIDYKSLFGYGWWGTLWRLIAVFQFAYLALAVLILFTVLLDRLVLSPDGGLSIPVLVIRFLCVISLILLAIFVIDMINRRTWRKAGWLKALRLPLITLGVLIVLLVAGEKIKPGAITAIFELLFFN